jgi:NUMOD3 motif
MCEVCHKIPHTQLACITGVYNLYLENWKYTCRSCNNKSDFANGTRHVLSGERSGMFGKNLSEETKQKMSDARRHMRKNFNQQCQCGSFYVIRKGTEREKQRLKCKECGKEWPVLRSLLIEVKVKNQETVLRVLK